MLSSLARGRTEVPALHRCRPGARPGRSRMQHAVAAGCRAI